MGLFGKKKVEKAKPQKLSISGEQLFSLVEKMVQLVKEDVEARCYIVGREIMFEYEEDAHFIGIKYDKKRAKIEKRVVFSEELMNAYVDKITYHTLKELHNNARINNVLLTDITEGIIVFPEFADLL